MAAPRGRGGRGGFGQNVSRPHDIFRQRKQNTSRPPSMHVDDFVAAEFKDIATPLGLLPPKRPPKSSPKPPTRGLFTGNRGRATFHSQTRFFTPPQPKSVLLSGKYTHAHTHRCVWFGVYQRDSVRARCAAPEINLWWAKFYWDIPSQIHESMREPESDDH